ncbi:helix-turn-helix transcriptional regulator [Clostridium cadaveris]|uniref:helix-turn-helix domain-containing protein n=1 Tax=Clostridium cadaveris TaxID=1529 RepID=UPI001459C279|nr:helix-turn-helix transcriptional regulator [Clostridium cadaveris]NME65660.1 helix-turn-helix transcriptional regulator [Clostridium cadaveris]
MSSFGQRLRELRTENNLTQEELASHFGLHKTRISQYELDKRQADDEMKKKFAIYFNVSLDWLMGLTDMRNYAYVPQVPSTLHYDYEFNSLPEEAKKEIANYIEYIKQKYKK